MSKNTNTTRVVASQEPTIMMNPLFSSDVQKELAIAIIAHGGSVLMSD
jgi:hypothetical protein